ncbi:hypothetical protein [Corynebacterium sanguinis]|uniref:hypothetical protein n=1 Tax=Corynebacterium sanguinis TaxID=2594913 RepID=UPI0021A8E321|nr:hypothetical protein [Corynebacterium sanguinis]MCT1464213.1 hypothetical protein [Corynebacterium sanguinis]MCT2330340.1 hypothetical protein [Corynebacterium sanguinis]
MGNSRSHNGLIYGIILGLLAGVWMGMLFFDNVGVGIGVGVGVGVVAGLAYDSRQRRRGGDEKPIDRERA